ARVNGAGTGGASQPSISRASSSKPVLRGAAEAVAASLIAARGDGITGPLEVVRPLLQLKDVLLAEHADSSKAAAARCGSLRAGFAAALKAALAKQPGGAALLAGDPVKSVRVEVRQTAGRSVLSEAFTVGRAAECDVQTSGDVTASRLQFLAVSLPSGIAIIDGWSSSGTRIVRRSGSNPDFSAWPSSLPTRRSVLLVPHGERVTLLTGAKTTVTLGPAGKDVQKAATGKELSAAAAAAGTSPARTAGGDIASTAGAPPLTSVALDAARTVASTAAVSSSAPAPVGLAAPISAASESVPPLRVAEQSSCSTAQNGCGPSTLAGGVGSPALSCPPKANATSASAKSCLAAVRASMRMQQHAALRDRVRARCRAARRALLLTEGLCAELQERLRHSAESVKEVRDILDGLGVPLAPDDLAAPGTAAWSCTICQGSQRTRGWHCPFRHRYCRDCTVRSANQRDSPTCPHEGCGYRLGEHDLQDLRVSEARLKAFCAARALRDGPRSGEQAIEGASSLEQVFRCPSPSCGAAVVLRPGEGKGRQCWSCCCGAAPVCTGCGATPFHHHGRCEEILALRARWLAWQNGGREAYEGLQRRANRTIVTQYRALKEAMQHVEQSLQSEQSQESQESVFAIGTSALAKASSATVAQAMAAALSGHGVRHLLTQCSVCGSGGHGILGPRFRCIHCPSFSCCQKCETRLASEHPEGHVFEIMFEDDLDWEQLDVKLPRGTRARLRRGPLGPAPAGQVGEAPGDQAGAEQQGGVKRKLEIVSCEGIVKGQKRGKYTFELLEGLGALQVAPGDLQPLLSLRQAKRLLSLGVPGLQPPQDSGAP
ncbi:unnamed protein product, partial [Polarella glacialis]